MRKNFFPAVLIAAIAAAIFSAPAQADDTGLALTLHSATQKGRTLCLTEHEHLGTSNSQPSKKAGVAAAILSWREFTAFEYGTDWASWRRAAGRRIACSRSSTGYSCEATARPCKRVSRRRTARRRRR